MTAADGDPLAGLRVVLEASTRSFDFKTFKWVKGNTFRRSAETDSAGRYELLWNSSYYYNKFELLVGMTVRVPDGKRFYTLESVPMWIDETEEGPLVVDVTVTDTRFLDRYRSFISALDTDDEHATFERLGIPAKIDRLQLATHEETTWWYFEAGKAIRFEDGRLEETIEFEPVEPFENEN